MKKRLFVIADTPTQPNFDALYQQLGYEVVRLESQRKAISELKRNPPDVMVGEFIYSFNTYYQAINISNLDVFLHSLVKYAPQTKVIVLVGKDHKPYVDKLHAIHTINAIIDLPTNADVIERVFADL